MPEQKKMKNLLIFTFLAAALGGCQSDDGIPRFESMSELELAEYNRGRPLDKMIVCSDGNRDFSRVRRRRCTTVEAMYGSAAQAEKLGVLNSVPGLGAGN